MRHLLPLLLCLSLTSACFSKDDGDEDDDGSSADDLTGDWSDGADGGADGGDGGGDGADGSSDLTHEEAATRLAEGVCDWVGTCYGYEAIGAPDHEVCVIMQADALLSEFSECDIDSSALRDCLDELERAERECDDPGALCSFEEICR